MRILIFNTLYSPERVGGAEISVQLLAEALAAKGYQVRVVCLTKAGPRLEASVNGVSVVYLPLRNIYWPFDGKRQPLLKKIIWHLLDQYNFLMKRSVSKEIESFRPDLVHTNNLSGFSVSVWSAAKKYGLKVLHTSRDYYLFHHDCKLFDSKARQNIEPRTLSVMLLSMFKKFQSRHVDAYVGISKYIATLHTRHQFFINASDKVIYNTIPSPVSGGGQPASQPPGDPHFLLTFGFIGRLTIDKGFDVFCKLAKELANSGPYRFVAAGKFDDLGGMQQLAIESGVLHLGYVPVNEFMGLVDFVVLPSQWAEPFGRAVVEGIAHGKIVLTNRVGGISELAELLPNIHFLEDFEHNNIFSLKPEQVMKVQMLQFESEYVCQQYEDAYAALAGSRHASAEF